MRMSGWAYYAASIPRLMWGIRDWPLVVAAFLGRPLAQPAIITLRRSGLKFRVRTAMDIWIIKETCIDRDYERVGVDLQDGWTILDIGAGLGDFTVYAARRCPHSSVYAYEPFPESFALLNQNLELNGIRNVQARPYAVSGESGVQALNIGSAEAVQHSTTLAGVRSIEVASVTLDQLFVDHRLSACEFLKMDVEGAEYAILFNANERTLRHIRHIVMEYHDPVLEGSHQALGRYLADRGFEITTRPNPVHAHLGYLHARNLQFDD